MLNAHEFNLFITPGSLPPVLHMGQYDSGRQWTAKLKNRNGEAYTPPSGATATIAGTNKKRVSWILNADISGSSVTFTPEGAATDQFGKMQVTLTIEDNGEQITALALIFDIQKAGVTNEEAATSPEFETAMQAAAAEAVEDAMTEAGILFAANQDTKSNEMTQPVGVDGNGKLWTTPGEGGGSTEGAVLYNQSQSLNSTQKSQARTNIGAGTYSKPSGGVPKTDLASAVQTSLGKADSAYQKPSGGITIYDLAQDVQQSISRADTAYQKPSGGIPATDMAQAVQTALTAAGTAVQPSVLASYVPRGKQATKSVNDTVRVAIASDGTLYVPTYPEGGGGTPAAENTQLITMTYYDGDTYASDTAAQIYDTLQDGAVNLVLIDRAGRECYLVKPPESDSGATCIAKFATYDESTDKTIIYTISATGVVTSTSVGGYYIKPSGGIPQTDLASALSGKIDGALQTGNLAAKTSAMTQAVGYDSTTGKLFTAPGSGGGGGAAVFEVHITESNGTYTASETFADIQLAIASGSILKVYNENGAECSIVSNHPSNDIVLSCIDDGDGGVPPRLRVYTIASDESVDAVTREILNSLIEANESTRTAAQVGGNSGFSVYANEVITVTGAISGFKLATASLPTMRSDRFIEIRFEVGSTAINNASWPDWCHFMGGFDATHLAANTYYKVLIDNAGNAVVGMREVTA